MASSFFFILSWCMVPDSTQVLNKIHNCRSELRIAIKTNYKHSLKHYRKILVTRYNIHAFNVHNQRLLLLLLLLRVITVSINKLFIVHFKHTQQQYMASVFGPLPFLLYINDMPSHISPGTSLKLFANDTMLYRQINNHTNQDNLQNELDRLTDWEKHGK